MELLSDVDLHFIANVLKIPLNEVLQKNRFAQLVPKQGGYIINLQSSLDGNGTHWTALMITESYAVYWDSFGLPIPTPILRFIYRHPTKLKIIYSVDQIQVTASVWCGWFCLYFLYFMTVLHKNVPDKKKLLNKHNAIYSLENKHLNDRILHKLVKNAIKGKPMNGRGNI